jgi:predicted hydrocarbon binding protein
MESTNGAVREAARDGARDVAIPATGLVTLRRQLQREAGSLAAIHALHAAGYAAGESLWESLRKGPARELADLDADSFWTRIAAVLGRRGWGTIEHRSAHPGVGLLESGDWAESSGGDAEDQPACSFSTGLLSGLLSGAAGGPIAVLEVTCRTQGDARCTFAFGSAATVHDLYGLLLDGRPLDSALASL